ncbi:MAG: hypothetical protein L3J62_10155 [Gammaproteobacteria bacterium]|nr:hypothetical protein [Gammaproteobacteria bacterium]MCF6231127.1 hypothetical protein [Gammaproteobacteria bacterium]
MNQQKLGLGETLWCNWALTKKKYEEGKLLIFEGLESGLPIADMWDDFGIIEV